MTEEEVKATKITKFSGEKEDWPIWRSKFLARARRLGHKGILKGTDKVSTDEKAELIAAEGDSAKDEIEKCKKWRALDEDAHEDLIDFCTICEKVAIPVISKEFLTLSVSSSLLTEIPERGSFPS